MKYRHYCRFLLSLSTFEADADYTAAKMRLFSTFYVSVTAIKKKGSIRKKGNKKKLCKTVVEHKAELILRNNSRTCIYPFYFIDANPYLTE